MLKMIFLKKLNGETYRIINSLEISYLELKRYCLKFINESFFYKIVNNGDIIFTDLFDYTIISNKNIILDNLYIIFLPYNKVDIQNIKKYLNINKYIVNSRLNILFDEQNNPNNPDNELINNLDNANNEYNNIMNIINNYKDDELFTLMLVDTFGDYYVNISEEFKSNFIIIDCALKNSSVCKILKNVPDDIKSNKDFFFKYVVNNSNYFKYASDKLKEDVEYVLKLIDVNPNIFYNISSKLYDNEEIIIRTYKSFIKSNQDAIILKYTSNTIRDNKIIILFILKHYGCELLHVSDRLKKDKEVVLMAIKQNGYAINYIGYGYYDEDILMTALYNKNYYLDSLDEDNSWCLLSKVPIKLRDNEKIVLKAIEYNGINYVFASERIKKDKKIIIEIIKRSYKMCKNTSRYYILENIINNIKLFNIILENVIKDKEICFTIVNKMRIIYNNFLKKSVKFKSEKNILKKIIFIYRNKLRIKKIFNKINSKYYQLFIQHEEQYQIRSKK